MSTGYTREQLHQLRIVAAQNIPPEQTAEQLDDASRVTNAAITGTGKGALIRLDFDDGATRECFLNCLVALDLVTSLLGAAEEQDWRMGAGQPGRGEQDSERPSDKRIWDALKVIALRVDSTPDGALISFGTGRTVSQFFLPQKIAQDVVAGITSLAQRSEWWTADRQLIPIDR